MRLAIDGLSKAFAVPVLRAVSLEIAPGEVRGLVCENGAGKSTLINIVSGVLRPDSGSIALDGEPFRPRIPRDAIRTGIAVASQELSLIDTLSVAENLMLRQLPEHWGVVERRTMRDQALRLLAEVGLEGIAPETPLKELSLSERQLIEFAKAISKPCRLLILDEPTAALTGPQADLLHDRLRAKVKEGTAVIYVSHRLADVREVCDNISVLRDGEIVATRPSADFSIQQIIEAMTGHAREQTGAVDRVNPRSAEPLLVARGITTKQLPFPLDLDLYGGEIIGVAGLAGAGRTELVEALYGLAPLKTGRVERVRMGVTTPIRSTGQAVREGIGLVSEDRKLSGIFSGRSIRFNMSLPGLGKLALRGVVDRKRELGNVLSFASRLRVRATGPEQDIARLSGGNQQKVLLARWLMHKVDVLLLDEPTRGVDVGAKYDIHDEIRELAASGCAVLIVSSELEELTALADRILVLSAKKPVAEFQERPFDSGAILEAAFKGYMGDRAGRPALQRGAK